MNHFERAIARLERKVAACDELIEMAKKDIEKLQKQRTNALKVIEEYRKIKLPELPTDIELDRHVDSPEEFERWKKLDESTRRFFAMIEDQARQIADQEPYHVSCMTVGIEV
jgi:hypothetical protein